jgi:hypothetical protein
MLKAMRLTGGYVDHLRDNAGDLYESTTMDDDAKKVCIKLGKFVAFMRARPSTRQDETAEREFAARLVSQLIRLAKSLAVVINRPTVDAEVLSRVTRVAKDTARGRTLEIAKVLQGRGEEGSDIRELSLLFGESENKLRHLLKFLRKIHAVEFFRPEQIRGISSAPRWRLTPRILKLFTEIGV